MVLSKQSLFLNTYKHFELARDPFHNEIHSSDDVYTNSQIRYAYESLWYTATQGGTLALIAESGAGKTTLMRDLEGQIYQSNIPSLLVKPYVLAMDDNEQKGIPLKASHIAEAIMNALNPIEKLKRSPEGRFAQLHKALVASQRLGYQHCLIIDEAHALSISTIRHLKRFAELSCGFKKLLAIILLGQPELRNKLSGRNQEIREMVQRCDIIELKPFDNKQLKEYLQHKFQRINKSIDTIIDASGIEALHNKLSPANSRNSTSSTASLSYPLIIGNLLTAAMNLAAELGAPIVNADVVKGV